MNQVQLNKRFWVVAVGCGVLTFGVFGAFLWWLAGRFPLAYDAQRLVLRNGTTLEWSALELVELRVRGGRPHPTHGMALYFPGVEVSVSPALLVGGASHATAIYSNIPASVEVRGLVQGIVDG